MQRQCYENEWYQDSPQMSLKKYFPSPMSLKKIFPTHRWASKIFSLTDELEKIFPTNRWAWRNISPHRWAWKNAPCLPLWLPEDFPSSSGRNRGKYFYFEYLRHNLSWEAPLAWIVVKKYFWQIKKKVYKYNKRWSRMICQKDYRHDMMQTKITKRTVFKFNFGL